ncbi:hypothetical protein [Streptococcus suis]
MSNCSKETSGVLKILCAWNKSAYAVAKSFSCKLSATFSVRLKSLTLAVSFEIFAPFSTTVSALLDSSSFLLSPSETIASLDSARLSLVANISDSLNDSENDSLSDSDEDSLNETKRDSLNDADKLVDSD